MSTFILVQDETLQCTNEICGGMQYGNMIQQDHGSVSCTELTLTSIQLYNAGNKYKTVQCWYIH